AWVQRLGAALAGPDPTFEVRGLNERHLPDAVQRWTRQVTSLGGEGQPMIGFRLEEPAGRKRPGPWRVSYHLLDATAQSRVAVSDLKAGDDTAREVASRMTKPAETLLEALGRCAGMYAPIERSLSDRLPASVEVDATEAWAFLTAAGMKLQRAGYWVNVPVALSKVGHRRVRARMRLGTDDVAAPSSGLLTGMVNYRWEACLGDDTLTAAEFQKLVKAKAPLVLHRGEWVAVDPQDVARLETLMARGGGGLDAAEALRLALAGEVSVPGTSDIVADVTSDGEVLSALQRLRESLDDTAEMVEPPMGLFGTLRPYQRRGLSWLDSVTGIGFGACLADDMGLGKTIQVLSHMLLLAERGQSPRCLVVCPTSVIGNWRREVQRFTPGLGVLVHHGTSRPSTPSELVAAIDALDVDDGTLVITSYALVRRDVELFSEVSWDAVILDEAQNIKNSESAQSQAVRRVSADRRFALTGTPVENRLMELWSIMDFLNPGLLGTRGAFQKMFAIPIERYGDEEAIDRLQRVTAPFVMRRLKTDPVIAPDLPEKIETVRYCPLTVEQAALYQTALDQ
ncbi:MAG: SNF2-related protein, partial [Myxococcota bacterium]|nr:SNF2-related protein [Myxococcota bacterium]